MPIRLVRLVAILAVSSAVFTLRWQVPEAADSPRTSKSAAKTSRPGPGKGSAADCEALLDQVGSIGFSGVPGEILVFGDTAFPVVAARTDGRDAVYIAAARVKKGRVLAVGHPGLLTEVTLGDTPTFYKNALTWLASPAAKTPAKAASKPGAPAPFRVGIREGDQLVEHLRAAGVDAVALTGNDWTQQLPQFRVVMLPVFRVEPKVVGALRTFVENGGGLVVASLGWAWQGYHAKPGEILERDADINRLCIPFGLAFGPAMLKNPAGSNVLKIESKPAPELHLATAFNTFTEQLARTGSSSATSKNAAAKAGGTPPTSPPGSLAKLALGLDEAMRTLPAAADLRTRILDFAQKPGRREKPITHQQPAGPEDDLRKAFATLEMIAALHSPVDRLTAAPSSNSFPGAVPKAARRLKDFALEINTDVDGWRGGNGLVWQSTGLYVPPGEAVELRLPKEAADWGLVAQIGCHNDGIAHHPSWSRPPRITRQFPLEKPITKIGSGYGGLLYILVPPRQPHGLVTVKCTGAVRAPSFVLGQSDVTEWRFSERDLPAPFGELVCDRIVLTVQASDLKRLDHPDKILEQWRKIVDCYADLAGIPFERKCPERFVPDHQIGGGWLHSGYPMMAQDLDRWSGRLVADEFVFKTGEWGFFHELGHNHQEPEWTFEGTGEVTCNVFGMYVFDTLFNGSRPHDEVQPAARERKEREYVAAGRPFDQWKQDPFLALVMYEQLVQGFGWEPFKAVFREYRVLPPAERPRTESEKHDQWLVRMSKATGRNLGPFFQHWGIPVSEAARNQVKDLPEWMPGERKSRAQ